MLASIMRSRAMYVVLFLALALVLALELERKDGIRRERG